MVGEAARKHDQSIKVAVAIMQGKYQMPSRTCEESGEAMYLHRVTDADLPQEFLRSYEQVQIGSSFGGHGLRDWARHSDAAFVGTPPELWEVISCTIARARPSRASCAVSWSFVPSSRMHAAAKSE